MAERIDVAPLREAVKNSGMSMTGIALEVGFSRTMKGRATRTGDMSRLKRALGITPETVTGHKRAPYYNKNISYDLAMKIATIIDVDPIDVGL